MKTVEWKPGQLVPTWNDAKTPDDPNGYVWLKPGTYRLGRTSSAGEQALLEVIVKPGEILTLGELLRREANKL